MTAVAHEAPAGVAATLRALVDATPPPPEDEPDGLLAAFDVMVAVRAELLARLAGLALTGLAPSGHPLLEELRRRDEAWLSALTRAQTVVGDRLRSVRRAQRAER